MKKIILLAAIAICNVIAFVAVDFKNGIVDTKLENILVSAQAHGEEDDKNEWDSDEDACWDASIDCVWALVGPVCTIKIWICGYQTDCDKTHDGSSSCNPTTCDDAC